ncbi:MAG: hypothetical protein A2Y78_12190 [Acidobacteria bacterium RBG_13_68_16]|jgi:hypothetical protein|nr:MAG: hypothetical protein A2Y78_12190 [Acidobacteria bacterium RBG_13_68_16]
MNPVLLVLVAAQAAAPPSATPTPTPRLNILLSRPGSEVTAPTGSLADVAKRIKLKLPEGQPRIITNDNLKQLSEGVELTTAKGVAGTGYAPVGQGPADQKKAIWQQRYREAVTRVAALEADIKRLEGEANRLEREFYAHDDPAQRDGVVKPAWDKTVANLRKAQADLAEARNKPEQVLEEARRNGALPGWFRGLDEPGAAAPRGASPESHAPARPRTTPTAPSPVSPGPR